MQQISNHPKEDKKRAYVHHHMNIRTHAQSLFMLLLLLVVGAGQTWGQTDYSGVYYIINNNTNGYLKDAATNWYLVPASNGGDTSIDIAKWAWNNDANTPLVTTYQTGKDNNSVWVVKKSGDYYYLIHPLTNKYMTLNDGVGTNSNRRTFHMEVPFTLGDNHLFTFTAHGTAPSQYYSINPKTKTSGNMYLNPSKGNRSYYYGSDVESGYYVGGTIGLYSSNATGDAGSKWNIEEATLPAPTITFDPDAATFTISYDKIPAGFDILYTTNGSTPTIGGATTTTITTTTATSSEAIPVTGTSNYTVKAVIARYGFVLTQVASQLVGPPDPPTITLPTDCSNTVTMSVDGATIYYTLDGTDPDKNSTLYQGPFVLNEDATIKAVAYNGSLASSVTTVNYTPQYSAIPTITRQGVTITISGTGNFYYTTDGTDPDTGSTLYNGPITLTDGTGEMTIKAVAKDGSKELSCVAETTFPLGIFISSVSDLDKIASQPNGLFIVSNDFDASSLTSSISGFTGVFDGGYYTISGLKTPLFTALNGGTVKNVILSGVNISGGANAGAICDEADGATKIYNCGVQSGSISGTNAGGLVGHIASGSSVRVVNCYNYADVSGGDYAAGIVGWNEGSVGDVRIAMCMMYGTVSGATNISPVYAGNHTSNAQNFTEYNYYLYSTEKNAAGQRIIRIPYTAYNDQLAIDKEEYLTRFPFYRHILNTHRELATYFLFDDYTSTHVEEIGHWAVKRGADAPKYPVVESWVKNRKSTPTFSDNNLPNTTDDYAGKLLTDMGRNGYLHVTINIDGSYSTDLPITDMDTLRYDYNYGKVILPFANEFEVNTDYSRICTGWKITGVTGGTAGTFENYNFADRDCTSKDIYDETNNPFIYAQGGYFIVPNGVTDITIEANFATAVYLSDATYDIGYTSSYDGRTGLGGNVPTFHGMTVYNSLATAIGALSSTTTNPHKQAIVLVGNYHYDLAKTALATTKGFTLMSIDADNNQEPDYGFYSIAPDRPQTPALRFDFVPIISLGMAAKVNGSTYYPGIPIWKPRGWYEQTETTVSIMNQFELDSGNFTSSGPCIINGGYFVQMIRSRDTNCSKVSYFKIGGNAYIKEFYPGSHSSKTNTTTIVPVNVTGGQVDECYMTGYKSGAIAIGSDIRFWCSGGKIGKFLGAYMDKPKQTSGSDGNVNMTAKIDHALIGRFFGGGTSESAAITGDINVTINNSKVDFYCGGPEFGNMVSGKTVTTNAENTIFGEYYGAGFGGTAITYTPVDGTPNIGSSVPFPSSYYTYNSNTDGKKRLSRSGSLGLATCYKFEFLMHSADKAKLVARFITGYAKFDLATTGSVTNNLTGCTIEHDFYGAGCQGKVDGTVTSTLKDCEVKGSAFGGGYKAESNEVEVYPATAPAFSVYNGETGIFSEFGTTEPETFTWEQGYVNNPTADDTNKKLYTNKDVTMSDLGNVTGAITITIDEGTTVGGSVFGGGNESKSLSNTTVKMVGGSVTQDVYGGGNAADVGGGTTINLTGGTVTRNVYGGGKGILASGTEGEDGYVAPVAAMVAGDVQITLNGTQVDDGQGTITYPDQCVVNGSIFGCNNLNGTPQGNVTVTIYKTWGTARTAQDDLESIDDTKHKYHLAAVYGGGNLAEYVPTAANGKTHVIIYGCDLTSIRTVYGGGNAACTPATQVDVYGTYEIEEVFGGGNGKDDISYDGTTYIENPGANVGYHNYSTFDAVSGKWIDNTNADTKEERQESGSSYLYGSGEAAVNIYGGLIHRVFGGSNMKGNVREVAVTMLDSQSDCEFQVDEAYGGGKSAPMDGAAQLIMDCIPGLKAAYGGAEEADIHNDVILNITNGSFDRVFGGNNVRGTIDGTITVNIEETGCRPVIIGQLYGGGNQAPYEAPFVEGSTTERRPGPTLNVRSFTSIGEVYGGGYGATAVVTGDTHVNINVSEGKFKNQDNKGNDNVLEETIREISYTEFRRTTDGDFVLDNDSNRIEDKKSIAVIMPSHAKGAIGAIYNVYGGGNAANVIGNTFVNIGTATDDQQLFATPTDATEAERTKAVIGADIRGNVYGGGNAADVTGNTNVKIGR